MSEADGERKVWSALLAAATGLKPQGDDSADDWAMLISLELRRLRAERDELEALFEHQRVRERPWIERWRQETGREDSLPDYGAMLEWIIGKADTAEAELTRLRGA